MESRIEHEYLSERLCHFWPDQNTEQAFNIFTSIMERGLLLTCGDGPQIGRFSYDSVHDKISIDLLQRSRICFTDIPEDKLEAHAKTYGRCGLGFSRRTVLRWGGLPVWYLPNHPEKGTLEELGAYYLRGLRNAEFGLAIVKCLFDSWKKEHLAAYNFFTSINIGGRTLTRENVEEMIVSAGMTVNSMQSYIKEMSPLGVDDHSYLYEREWRIVSGGALGGIPFFRQLTEDEKADLAKARPEWSKPMCPTQYLPNHTYPSEPLIDKFHYFNGIPSESTISQCVEVVYVPDVNMKKRVEEYVAANPNRFRAGGVFVRVFSV